jgi:hypothetical protein
MAILSGGAEADVRFERRRQREYSQRSSYSENQDKMSQTFAEVVEDVKQLSSEEKQELQELLKQYLIEERRREIVENYQTSLEEMKNGDLLSFTDTDKLCDSLSDD